MPHRKPGTAAMWAEHICSLPDTPGAPPGLLLSLQECGFPGWVLWQEKHLRGGEACQQILLLLGWTSLQQQRDVPQLNVGALDVSPRSHDPLLEGPEGVNFSKGPL